MTTQTAKPAARAAAPAPTQSPAVAKVDSDESSMESEDPVAVAPVVEHVNMSGLVLEKTAHPDGACETRVISEPMITEELVRATSAAQRQQGF